MRRVRIIDQLRKRYPGFPWRYSHHTFTWTGRGVGTVIPVSQHSPRYDGDEERYTTRYSLLKPDGKREWVDLDDYRAYDGSGFLKE